MWSLTTPIACINAYTVVGPTKRHPRRLRSFDSRTEAAVCDGSGTALTASSSPPAGSNPQMYRANEPNSSINSPHRCALLMVASILPRWRTMPASPSKRATSASSNCATVAGSNPANARRKFSRLRRMVIQLSPD